VLLLSGSFIPAKYIQLSKLMCLLNVVFKLMLAGIKFPVLAKLEEPMVIGFHDCSFVFNP
jgi:hypothetical protein